MSAVTEHSPPVAASVPSAVIARLRQAYGVATDAELQRVLGLAGGAIANWRARGTVPYSHCVSVAAEGDWSLDWLLLGRGPQKCHWTRDDSASYAPNVDASITPRPAAGDTVQHVGRLPRDERLGALVDWLIDWWASATAESRSWLIVEVGELRRKWLLDRIRAQMAQPPPADTDAGEG